MLDAFTGSSSPTTLSSPDNPLHIRTNIDAVDLPMARRSKSLSEKSKENARQWRECKNRTTLLFVQA
jgi:hypothetical protein